MNYLFWIGFIFATPTGTAIHSSDVVMVSTLGGRVILPCAVSSGSPCSSVTWTKADSPSPLVMTPNAHLLRDCSLQISNIHGENATTYTCENGQSKSSVALRILNISEKVDAAQGARADAAKGKILHCYLNNENGLVPDCNRTGALISWLAEDNTEIKENSTRVQFANVTNCFVKLFLQPKQTDHHRKWKCQVSQNGSAKATISHIITLEDGIEEVFAAVGESLSLTCANISSLGLTGKGQTATSVTFTGSATVISKVSPLHAGDYHCVGKPYQIRIHTFDITSELDPEGQNVTLTCVLTCANNTCDKDFSLTWSEDDTQYSTLLNVSGRRINKLSIPLLQLGPGEKVCSVLREGVQVATKKWHYDNSAIGCIHVASQQCTSLQCNTEVQIRLGPQACHINVSRSRPGLAWIALPIVLLCIAATVVFCMYRKRKRNKDPEHIGMTHVYEDVKDYEPQCKREAVTSNDSFYDLLQAVN